jgi:hypothetical protein
MDIFIVPFILVLASVVVGTSVKNEHVRETERYAGDRGEYTEIYQGDSRKVWDDHVDIVTRETWVKDAEHITIRSGNAKTKMVGKAVKRIKRK